MQIPKVPHRRIVLRVTRKAWLFHSFTLCPCKTRGQHEDKATPYPFIKEDRLNQDAGSYIYVQDNWDKENIM